MWRATSVFHRKLSWPAIAVALAAWGSAAEASAAGLLSRADESSFARLAVRLPGHEGLSLSAAGRGRPVQTLGSLRSGVAWSTAKVPVAMAAIRAGVARQSDLERAIGASDNAAAERLWAALGGGRRAAAAAERQLRAAGDRRTTVESRRLRAGFTAFGQTLWRLGDQVHFTAAMGCLSAGRRVLEIMGRVVPSQRWGLGAARRGARFKGGWGPGITPGRGDGWMERQMGVIEVGGKPIAVAVASDASDHGTATRNLTALARWAASHANVRGLPGRAGC